MPRILEKSLCVTPRIFPPYNIGRCPIEGGMKVFNYRKRLFYPVHVERQDPIFAKVLLEHYAGKDSELSSSIQYLNHRSNMSNRYIRELLGLIAAEELGHMEILSVAINKLGGQSFIWANSDVTPWSLNFVDQSADAINMLKVDVEAETRASQLYYEHLALTSDPNMKRMISFLIGREEVHQRLLQKALMLISESGSSEEFNELIYDYKISLQILE